MLCGTRNIPWNIFIVNLNMGNIVGNIFSPTNTVMDLNSVMYVREVYREKKQTYTY